MVRPKRGRQTALDMVRSLGLMFVVILVLLLVTPARTLIFPSSGGGEDQAVSDSEQLAEWHQLTGRAALLPPVPVSWRINAATMTGTSVRQARLHVGWATPQNGYVGVDQGFVHARKLIKGALGGGSHPAAPTTIGGRQWSTRVDVHGDPAYLLTTGRFSVIVTGTIGPAALQRLAAELHPTGS